MQLTQAILTTETCICTQLLLTDVPVGVTMALGLEFRFCRAVVERRVKVSYLFKEVDLVDR